MYCYKKQVKTANKVVTPAYSLVSTQNTPSLQMSFQILTFKDVQALVAGLSGKNWLLVLKAINEHNLDGDMLSEYMASPQKITTFFQENCKCQLKPLIAEQLHRRIRKAAKAKRCAGQADQQTDSQQVVGDVDERGEANLTTGKESESHWVPSVILIDTFKTLVRRMVCQACAFENPNKECIAEFCARLAGVFHSIVSHEVRTYCHEYIRSQRPSPPITEYQRTARSINVSKFSCDAITKNSSPQQTDDTMTYIELEQNGDDLALTGAASVKDVFEGADLVCNVDPGPLVLMKKSTVCEASEIAHASMTDVVNKKVSDENIANGSNNDNGKPIQTNKKRKNSSGPVANTLCARAKLEDAIANARQKIEKSPCKRSKEQTLKLPKNNAVCKIIDNWHNYPNFYAPLTLKKIYFCLFGVYSHTDLNLESAEHLHVSVEWAGSGKILSRDFLLSKAAPIENLGALVGTLLPPQPRYRPYLHRVFHGHGGKELTSPGASTKLLDRGVSSLLEKEFVQLISTFRAKNGKHNHSKMMNQIVLSKKAATGPLQFMQKYIDKMEYSEEIRLACLQWAQAYRQEYRDVYVKTCGEVLISGDLLVILPGVVIMPINLGVCMARGFSALICFESTVFFPFLLTYRFEIIGGHSS